MSDARDNYITISKHEWDHYGDLKTRNAELAAEREALKAERDATKHELSMVRDVARADNLRADMADQYERWLLDLGRISGCGHLDDRLPQCIEEAFESLRTQLAAAKAERTAWRLAALTTTLVSSASAVAAMSADEWQLAESKAKCSLLDQLAAAQKTIEECKGREGRLREALKAAHDLLDQHMAGMVRMGHKMRSEGKLTAANEENMATEIADVDRVKAIFPLTAALGETDGASSS